MNSLFTGTPDKHALRSLQAITVEPLHPAGELSARAEVTNKALSLMKRLTPYGDDATTTIDQLELLHRLMEASPHEVKRLVLYCAQRRIHDLEELWDQPAEALRLLSSRRAPENAKETTRSHAERTV